MYVYIIRSLKYGRHYTGMTENVNRRFSEHVSGLVSKTRYMRPFELVHVQLVKDRKEARRFEKFFKSGFGREIIKEIEENIFPL